MSQVVHRVWYFPLELADGSPTDAYLRQLGFTHIKQLGETLIGATPPEGWTSSYGKVLNEQEVIVFSVEPATVLRQSYIVVA